MKIGIVLPSVLASQRYRMNRIFAPLFPAVSLADGLVEKGHEVVFYGSGDITTKAQIVAGDNRLTDTDPFYYQFRYRSKEEQKYTTQEIIKRDFEYEMCLKAYTDASNGKLDIIHAYHDFGAHYFNELTTFPTVYTLHDPLPQTEDSIEYLRFSKFTHHNYVSISNAQRKSVVALNFIDTVYHGIALEHFEFGNSPQDHLIYFGRLLEDKGADIAIQVALESNMPLHIATTSTSANTDEQFYQTKIAPFVDGKKIAIHGFVQDKTRSNFIRSGKAFIFPLRWSEPFGLVMIESMAGGTPVIAYNRGSVSEIVRDGVTGFIVEPEESSEESRWIIKKKGMEGLVEAVQRIGEIDRKACREHVESNFTVSQMVENYEKVYKKVAT